MPLNSSYSLMNKISGKNKPFRVRRKVTHNNIGNIRLLSEKIRLFGRYPVKKLKIGSCGKATTTHIISPRKRIFKRKSKQKKAIFQCKRKIINRCKPKPRKNPETGYQRKLFRLRKRIMIIIKGIVEQDFYNIQNYVSKRTRRSSRSPRNSLRKSILSETSQKSKSSYKRYVYINDILTSLKDDKDVELNISSSSTEFIIRSHSGEQEEFISKKLPLLSCDLHQLFPPLDLGKEYSKEWGADLKDEINVFDMYRNQNLKTFIKLTIGSVLTQIYYAKDQIHVELTKALRKFLRSCKERKEGNLINYYNSIHTDDDRILSKVLNVKKPLLRHNMDPKLGIRNDLLKKDNGGNFEGHKKKRTIIKIDRCFNNDCEYCNIIQDKNKNETPRFVEVSTEQQHAEENLKGMQMKHPYTKHQSVAKINKSDKYNKKIFNCILEPLLHYLHPFIGVKYYEGNRFNVIRICKNKGKKLKLLGDIINKDTKKEKTINNYVEDYVHPQSSENDVILDDRGSFRGLAEDVFDMLAFYKLREDFKTKVGIKGFISKNTMIKAIAQERRYCLKERLKKKERKPFGVVISKPKKLMKKAYKEDRFKKPISDKEVKLLRANDNKMNKTTFYFRLRAKPFTQKVPKPNEVLINDYDMDRSTEKSVSNFLNRLNIHSFRTPLSNDYIRPEKFGNPKKSYLLIKFWKYITMKQYYYKKFFRQMISIKTSKLTKFEHNKTQLSPYYFWMKSYLEKNFGLSVKARYEMPLHLPSEHYRKNTKIIYLPILYAAPIEYKVKRKTVCFLCYLETQDSSIQGKLNYPKNMTTRKNTYSIQDLDLKYSMFAWLSALEAYKSMKGKFPFNVKFVIYPFLHYDTVLMDIMIDRQYQFFKKVHVFIQANGVTSRFKEPSIMYISRGMCQFHLRINCFDVKTRNRKNNEIRKYINEKIVHIFHKINTWIVEENKDFNQRTQTCLQHMNIVYSLKYLVVRPAPFTDEEYEPALILNIEAIKYSISGESAIGGVTVTFSVSYLMPNSLWIIRDSIYKLTSDTLRHLEDELEYQIVMDHFSNPWSAKRCASINFIARKAYNKVMHKASKPMLCENPMPLPEIIQCRFKRAILAIGFGSYPNFFDNSIPHLYILRAMKLAAAIITGIRESHKFFKKNLKLPVNFNHYKNRKFTISRVLRKHTNLEATPNDVKVNESKQSMVNLFNMSDSLDGSMGVFSSTKTFTVSRGVNIQEKINLKTSEMGSVEVKVMSKFLLEYTAPNGKNFIASFHAEDMFRQYYTYILGARKIEMSAENKYNKSLKKEKFLKLLQYKKMRSDVLGKYCSFYYIPQNQSQDSHKPKAVIIQFSDIKKIILSHYNLYSSGKLNSQIKKNPLAEICKKILPRTPIGFNIIVSKYYHKIIRKKLKKIRYKGISWKTRTIKKLKVLRRQRKSKKGKNKRGKNKRGKNKRGKNKRGKNKRGKYKKSIKMYRRKKRKQIKKRLKRRTWARKYKKNSVKKVKTIRHKMSKVVKSYLQSKKPMSERLSLLSSKRTYSKKSRLKQDGLNIQVSDTQGNNALLLWPVNKPILSNLKMEYNHNIKGLKVCDRIVQSDMISLMEYLNNISFINLRKIILNVGLVGVTTKHPRNTYIYKPSNIKTIKIKVGLKYWKSLFRFCEHRNIRPVGLKKDSHFIKKVKGIAKKIYFDEDVVSQAIDIIFKQILHDTIVRNNESIKRKVLMKILKSEEVSELSTRRMSKYSLFLQYIYLYRKEIEDIINDYKQFKKHKLNELPEVLEAKLLERISKSQIVNSFVAAKRNAQEYIKEKPVAIFNDPLPKAEKMYTIPRRGPGHQSLSNIWTEILTNLIMTDEPTTHEPYISGRWSFVFRYLEVKCQLVLSYFNYLYRYSNWEFLEVCRRMNKDAFFEKIFSIDMPEASKTDYRNYLSIYLAYNNAISSIHLKLIKNLNDIKEVYFNKPKFFDAEWDSLLRLAIPKPKRPPKFRIIFRKIISCSGDNMVEETSSIEEEKIRKSAYLLDLHKQELAKEIFIRFTLQRSFKRTYKKLRARYNKIVITMNVIKKHHRVNPICFLSDWIELMAIGLGECKALKYGVPKMRLRNDMSVTKDELISNRKIVKREWKKFYDYYDIKYTRILSSLRDILMVYETTIPMFTYTDDHKYKMICHSLRLIRQPSSLVKLKNQLPNNICYDKGFKCYYVGHKSSSSVQKSCNSLTTRHLYRQNNIFKQREISKADIDSSTIHDFSDKNILKCFNFFYFYAKKYKRIWSFINKLNIVYKMAAKRKSRVFAYYKQVAYTAEEYFKLLVQMFFTIAYLLYKITRIHKRRHTILPKEWKKNINQHLHLFFPEDMVDKIVSDGTDKSIRFMARKRKIPDLLEKVKKDFNVAKNLCSRVSKKKMLQCHEKYFKIWRDIDISNIELLIKTLKSKMVSLKEKKNKLLEIKRQFDNYTGTLDGHIAFNTSSYLKQHIYKHERTVVRYLNFSLKLRQMFISIMSYLDAHQIKRVSYLKLFHKVYDLPKHLLHLLISDFQFKLQYTSCKQEESCCSCRKGWLKNKGIRNDFPEQRKICSCYLKRISNIYTNEKFVKSSKKNKDESLERHKRIFRMPKTGAILFFREETTAACSNFVPDELKQIAKRSLYNYVDSLTGDDYRQYQYKESNLSKTNVDMGKRIIPESPSSCKSISGLIKDLNFRKKVKHMKILFLLAKDINETVPNNKSVDEIMVNLKHIEKNSINNQKKTECKELNQKVSIKKGKNKPNYSYLEPKELKKIEVSTCENSAKTRRHFNRINLKQHHSDGDIPEANPTKRPAELLATLKYNDNSKRPKINLSKLSNEDFINAFESNDCRVYSSNDKQRKADLHIQKLLSKYIHKDNDGVSYRPTQTDFFVCFNTVHFNNEGSNLTDEENSSHEDSEQSEDSDDNNEIENADTNSDNASVESKTNNSKHEIITSTMEPKPGTSYSVEKETSSIREQIINTTESLPCKPAFRHQRKLSPKQKQPNRLETAASESGSDTILRVQRVLERRRQKIRRRILTKGRCSPLNSQSASKVTLRTNTQSKIAKNQIPAAVNRRLHQRRRILRTLSPVGELPEATETTLYSAYGNQISEEQETHFEGSYYRTLDQDLLKESNVEHQELDRISSVKEELTTSTPENICLDNDNDGVSYRPPQTDFPVCFNTVHFNNVGSNLTDEENSSHEDSEQSEDSDDNNEIENADTNSDNASVESKTNNSKHEIITSTMEPKPGTSYSVEKVTSNIRERIINTTESLPCKPAFRHQRKLSPKQKQPNRLETAASESGSDTILRVQRVLERRRQNIRRRILTKGKCSPLNSQSASKVTLRTHTRSRIAKDQIPAAIIRRLQRRRRILRTLIAFRWNNTDRKAIWPFKYNKSSSTSSTPSYNTSREISVYEMVKGFFNAYGEWVEIPRTPSEPEPLLYESEEAHSGNLGNSSDSSSTSNCIVVTRKAKSAEYFVSSNQETNNNPLIPIHRKICSAPECRNWAIEKRTSQNPIGESPIIKTTRHLVNERLYEIVIFILFLELFPQYVPQSAPLPSIALDADTVETSSELPEATETNLNSGYGNQISEEQETHFEGSYYRTLDHDLLKESNVEHQELDRISSVKEELTTSTPENICLDNDNDGVSYRPPQTDFPVCFNTVHFNNVGSNLTDEENSSHEDSEQSEDSDDNNEIENADTNSDNASVESKTNNSKHEIITSTMEPQPGTSYSVEKVTSNIGERIIYTTESLPCKPAFRHQRKLSPNQKQPNRLETGASESGSDTILRVQRVLERRRQNIRRRILTKGRCSPLNNQSASKVTLRTHTQSKIAKDQIPAPVNRRLHQRRRILRTLLPVGELPEATETTLNSAYGNQISEEQETHFESSYYRTPDQELLKESNVEHQELDRISSVKEELTTSTPENIFLVTESEDIPNVQGVRVSVNNFSRYQGRK